MQHLAKLEKSLNCVLSTYVSSAFDCMFLSFHLHISESIQIYSCLNVTKLLGQTRCKTWWISSCNETGTNKNLVAKQTLLWVLIRKVRLIVCSYHVNYKFVIELPLYSCLSVNELFSQNKHKIWIWTDSNWTRTQRQLTGKQALNHLHKMVKQFSCVVSTNQYGSFDCIFLSCHVRISEWNHTL